MMLSALGLDAAPYGISSAFILGYINVYVTKSDVCAVNVFFL